MNFAKWISFCLVVICLYVLWQIKQLLLLLLTSVVLAIALNILVRQLQKWGIKRSYGVLISILFLLTLLISSFWLIVPSLTLQFQQLIKLVPQGIQKLIVELNLIKDSLSPELSNSLPNSNQLALQLQPLINELLGRGFSILSGFLGVLLSCLLLLALTLMLLVDPEPYRLGFLRIFPYFYRPRLEQILNLCEHNLEEWLTDIFLKMLIVTVLSFLGLLILGLPLVLAQAFLAGILAFIPYLGPLISVIAPVAIAMLSSRWKPWLVLILYVLIYQLAEKVLIPKLRKEQISLIPVTVIVGEIFFASFLGFLGLFLALPLTIISQILVKEILIKDILDRWQI
jgi:predicted PurR-regulated permease PerM